MACRKAADRALTEVSEWKAREEEQTATAWRQIEERLKPKWTAVITSTIPFASGDNDTTQVSTDSAPLCYAWLQDGWERGPTCGCNGGCGKDHPRIILEFDEINHRGSVATLSHPLKPFMDYFDNLCRNMQATRTSEGTTYLLHGFLKEHVDRLKMQKECGFHLVKVKTDALTTSRRAQEAFQRACDEEAERLAMTSQKKRKRNHDSVSGSQRLSNMLVEKVFQVIWDNHWFQDNLDLLDIHYWQMSDVASSMASRLALQRMVAVRLSFRVLLETSHTSRQRGLDRLPQQLRLNYEVSLPPSEGDGTVRVEIRHPEGYRSLTGLLEDYRLFPIGLGEGYHGEWMNRIDESGHPIVGRFPYNSSDDIRSVATGPRQNEDTCQPRNDDDLSHHGHVLQVFLQGYGEHVGSPSQRLLMSRESAVLGGLLEVARHRIDGSSSPNDRVNSIVCFSADEPMLEIKSLSLTFQDLVGWYVRRKLFTSRSLLTKIQRERPISHAERDHVRRLARAAREHVPGHARDFEGLQGWDNIND